MSESRRRGYIAGLPHARRLKLVGLSAMGSLVASLIYVVGFFTYLWFDRTE